MEKLTSIIVNELFLNMNMFITDYIDFWRRLDLFSPRNPAEYLLPNKPSNFQQTTVNQTLIKWYVKDISGDNCDANARQ